MLCSFPWGGKKIHNRRPLFHDHLVSHPAGFFSGSRAARSPAPPVPSTRIRYLLIFPVNLTDRKCYKQLKLCFFLYKFVSTLFPIFDIIKPIKRLMKKYSIPVYFCGPFPYKYAWYQNFLSYDIPTFDFWDAPTKCLKILYKYSEYRKQYS